jgi:hypothetical protein
VVFIWSHIVIPGYPVWSCKHIEVHTCPALRWSSLHFSRKKPFGQITFIAKHADFCTKIAILTCNNTEKWPSKICENYQVPMFKSWSKGKRKPNLGAMLSHLCTRGQSDMDMHTGNLAFILSATDRGTNNVR